MSEFQAKIREVAQSIIPVIIFVSLVVLLMVPVDTSIFRRFLLGAILIFVGLAIFLWGVDQSMDPIGRYMARAIAESRTLVLAIFLAFFLGFLITIAEPDLLILADEVNLASGGQIPANLLVLIISVGVGVLIAIGSLKILFSKSYNVIMTLIYGLILILGIFTSSQFLAIAFDASGATTGALTTPFVLAISLGLSRMKGGELQESDAFGLVGMMSAGPIISVMALSIITGQDKIQGGLEAVQLESEVLGPILRALGPTLVESLIALAPICLVFFIFNATRFKIGKRELFSIIRGLIYTLLGLTLFLTGAHEGFMDMGRVLGLGLAEDYQRILVILGFFLGFIIVSAEPAVHVLSDQIEDVTGGQLSGRTIGLTLSIGVGCAVSLSMARIMVPGLELWHFLLPGFLMAIALSYYVDPLFVGIAFDSGGVASGPMAATFVLAFAQGVASSVPTADVLADGFGIIAMIAMTPILAIMVLGSVYKYRRTHRPQVEAEIAPLQVNTQPLEEGACLDLVIIKAPRGQAREIIPFASELGHRGATLVHGVDAMAKLMSRYSMDLPEEVEAICLVVDQAWSHKLMDAILENFDAQAYALPIGSAQGLWNKDLVD